MEKIKNFLEKNERIFLILITLFILCFVFLLPIYISIENKNENENERNNTKYKMGDVVYMKPDSVKAAINFIQPIIDVEDKYGVIYPSGNECVVYESLIYGKE
jgi:hypothetical protein